MVYRPKEQAAAEAGEDAEGDEQEVSAEDQDENPKTARTKALDNIDAIVNQVLETQDSRIDTEVDADALDDHEAEDDKAKVTEPAQDSQATSDGAA